MDFGENLSPSCIYPLMLRFRASALQHKLQEVQVNLCRIHSNFCVEQNARIARETLKSVLLELGELEGIPIGHHDELRTGLVQMDSSFYKSRYDSPVKGLDVNPRTDVGFGHLR